MNSLRGKILFTYSLLAGLSAVLILFSWGDLRYLEQRIGEGVAVSAFQQDALEMRRHEKNYFLYHERSELIACQEQAHRLALNLEAHGGLMTSLSSGDEVRRLQQNLQNYTSKLALIGADSRKQDNEPTIRSTGHHITQAAEYLDQREREVMVEAVHNSRQALLVLAAGVLLLGLTASPLIARALLRPLRTLERELRQISEGVFDRFHAPSQDREIISLTLAMNRMLEELEARRRQVLQAEKLASLGTLASGVAHELNNPLGNISASAQILSEESPHPEQREWLEQIESETERARRIVRTLLDYVRRSEFRVEAVDIQKVVEKSLLLLANRRPDNDHLQLKLEHGLQVFADQQRLQQVLINLLSNALDAGGPDVHIRIRARHTNWADSRPGQHALVVGELAEANTQQLALICIEDDGPGIPTEHLPQVFTPFFTTREPGQGTGLGLYLVSEIIREHGGCVAAENLPSVGARFTLWLPCHHPERTP